MMVTKVMMMTACVHSSRRFPGNMSPVFAISAAHEGLAADKSLDVEILSRLGIVHGMGCKRGMVWLRREDLSRFDGSERPPRCGWPLSEDHEEVVPCFDGVHLRR